MTILRSLLGAVTIAALAACDPIDPTPKQAWPLVELTRQPEQNLQRACVATFDQEIDYFPDRTAFRHSAQLSVQYHRHYKQITFRPAVSAEETVTLLLVQCGAPVPDHAPTTVVVSVPVARIATASSSMLGAAADLGAVDSFVGVSEPRAVTVPQFRERIRQGAITAMGGHVHGNIEQIIGADPDVYFTFHSAYPQFNVHPRLWSLGIRAIPHGDSLEPTPLGRAEWLKLLALLTNTEDRANKLFDGIEQAYLRTAGVLAAGTRERPTVLAGTASQRDVMELFGGANHRARLIRDAGGRFVLEHDRFAGSWLITSFERVYAAGADAPYWIGTRPGLLSVEALIATNPHHRWFESAVGSGNVYALDRGYRGMFAYPLEDQGLNNPHRQLAEIAAILHPHLKDRLEMAEPLLIAPLFIRKLE